MHFLRSRRIVLAAALVASGASTPAGQAPAHTFDGDVGAAPPGFSFVATRQPDPGSWRIGERQADRFLVHAADAASTGYALAIAPGDPVQDVVLSTRITLAGGARAGGLIWRYQDPNNYYATVLDLSAGIITLQRVADGNRITLERRGDLELDPAAWHSLKVVHDGHGVYVSLGGIRVINERDRRLDRFGPGRTGLIATGDSEVWFDDLRIERPRERR